MSVNQRKGKADRELDAIGAILNALEGLEGESIQRVLDYVFGRLSISRSAHLAGPAPVSVVPASHGARDTVYSIREPSIRDLKDEKKPESSNQMAALVAYFLSEIAQEGERKDAINASDLERYFKQAGFKLPKAISQALPNAAAAGYFDATGSGLYRLNPVGYNLVVHGLPRSHGDAPHIARARRERRTVGDNPGDHRPADDGCSDSVGPDFGRCGEARVFGQRSSRQISSASCCTTHRSGYCARLFRVCPSGAWCSTEPRGLG
jgi:hypothetical protein